MPTKKPKSSALKPYKFSYKSRKFQVLLDKVLIFRLIKKLHGRFWGLMSVVIIVMGMSVCFAIRPDLLQPSTALSDFGNDIKTAPYFAGTMFFAAYGLWRWRNYLYRTLRRPQPIATFITLTILGLYLIAFMPVGWTGWPYRIHVFGVILIGLGMAATVIFDDVLSKVPRGSKQAQWRTLRFLSFTLIISGGFLTLTSTRAIEMFNVSLYGELMLFAGYAVWVCVKTRQGEGSQSALSRLVAKIVTIS